VTIGDGWALPRLAAARCIIQAARNAPARAATRATIDVAVPLVDGDGSLKHRNPAACLRQRGFTLVEVMVVVAILGILAALIVPKIIGRSDDARIVAARQDVATLVAALKLYRLDNQRYPTTDQGLKALVEKPTTDPIPSNWKAGGYLDRLPKDPWGHAYQFLQPGVKSELDIYSLGADGQPGGTGNDADIGSWDP
jgi:general secretion pathway protein G